MEEDTTVNKNEIKQQTSFIEYNSRILNIKDYPKVIDEARKEYSILPKYTPHEWTDIDIPLNLERMYIDTLLDSKDFETARRVLERMKISYPPSNPFVENSLEVIEYRIGLVESMEELIAREKHNLKHDLNQHNITTISVIVGIITIFGTANAAFEAKNYLQGLITFFAIVASICILVLVANIANNFYRNKK